MGITFGRFCSRETKENRSFRRIIFPAMVQSDIDETVVAFDGVPTAVKKTCEVGTHGRKSICARPFLAGYTKKLVQLRKTTFFDVLALLASILAGRSGCSPLKI